MSGDNYHISDQHNCCFLTLTIIHWIDVFSRYTYRNIIVDSLNYCSAEKDLVLYGWVIMTNHVHLIARVHPPHTMSEFLRDFKKFTTKRIIETIKNSNESRREWLLDKFSFEAKRTGRAKEFKMWKDDNHAIDLDSYNIDLIEKLDYVHMNPVRAGWVDNPEEYVFSSARDYVGKKGLVRIEIV